INFCLSERNYERYSHLSSRPLRNPVACFSCGRRSRFCSKDDFGIPLPRDRRRLERTNRFGKGKEQRTCCESSKDACRTARSRFPVVELIVCIHTPILLK